MTTEQESAPIAAAARVSQKSPAAHENGNGAESITDLVRHLATDISMLLRKELALAKSEVGESVTQAQTAIGAIVTGATIATAGLVVLLMSAVYGLSSVVAPWLAALIVGAAAFLIGFVMISSAKKKLSAGALAPERTMESHDKDKDTLQRAVQ